MKKIYSYLLLLSAVVLISCSQDEISNEKSDNPISKQEVTILSEDGKLSDSELQKCVEENMEKYQFGNPNSELWKESLLRSSNPNVSGYDSKVEISSTKGMFTKGYGCDSRIVPMQYYIVKTYQYKKNVQVPKGTSISIPPPNIMASYSPMGNVPGTNNAGYSVSNLISSNNTHDTYQFITEAQEITHNLSGQQIAPLSNPVYLPCKAITPANFVFVYQIVIW